MGKRKKKNKGGGGPAKRMQVPLPVPDDQANWPDWERHEVMMSVSMEYVPEDFENEFIAVICPVAKRRTVVAADGWTCSYNKLLNMDRKFQSVLPGGHLSSMMSFRTSNDICILDCLHYKAERTFYILDLMMWRQFPYYDSETEFRFHWISQMEEEMDLVSIHPENEYHFKSMPRIKCAQENLYTALENTTFKVDGILFFHQSCTYTPGSTPGVLWLAPEDIEKVLGWKPPPNVLPDKKQSSATPDASTAASAAASDSAAASVSATASDSAAATLSDAASVSAATSVSA